jgi:hypothetical protein
MRYGSYYFNFFTSLAASLSDDDFLTFVRQTYANLAADPAQAARAARLKPFVDAQTAARQAAGTGGKSGKVMTLGQTIRDFFGWVRLTNNTTVFAKFPYPTDEARLIILPKGVGGIYQADHSELLAEATTYVDGLKLYKGKLGDDAWTEGDVWLAKLDTALTGRGKEVKNEKSASTALDAAEQASCVVLFGIHGGLIEDHAASPKQAAAFFPYPDSEGPAAAPVTPDPAKV